MAVSDVKIHRFIHALTTDKPYAWDTKDVSSSAGVTAATADPTGDFVVRLLFRMGFAGRFRTAADEYYYQVANSEISWLSWPALRQRSPATPDQPPKRSTSYIFNLGDKKRETIHGDIIKFCRGVLRFSGSPQQILFHRSVGVGGLGGGY